MRDLITTGKLRDGQTFRVEKLTSDDLSSIITLQEKLKLTTNGQKFLEPLSYAEFSGILSGKGYMIGVFIDKKIVAFRAMAEPPIDEEHLGIDAGLPKEELPNVIYSEISNVDPDYQGNGLQKYMGKIVMKEVDNTRFRYVCATVAPFNIASLKDKFSLGMEIVALKEKYGRKLRYIFLKDLMHSKDERACTEKLRILMGEMEQQQKILQSGFIGTSIEKTEGNWHVQYCKF